MNRLHFLVGVLSLGLFFLSCQRDNKQQKDGIALNEEGEEVNLDEFPLPSFPPMPADSIQAVLQETDRVVLQLLGTPEETIFDEASDVRRILGFLTTEMANVNRDCKISGFLKLVHQGKSQYHLDVFTQDNCSYAIIYKNNQARYAQKLSAEGSKFINDRMNLN